MKSALPSISPSIRLHFRIHFPKTQGGTAIKIIVHYPATSEGRRELARLAGIVHAQTVIEKVRSLDCPVEQKMQLLEAIKRRAQEQQNT